MIKFEKVSYDQFTKDVLKYRPELTEEEIKNIYDDIKLPQRSTKFSAGYDFYAPYSFKITMLYWSPVTIPTGIRVVLPQDRALLLLPRSGIGFSTGTSLANTIGLVDPDFFTSDSGGHIIAKMVSGFDPLYINKGERFLQGIIIPFELTDDDNAQGDRTGGLGSTGR